MTHARIPTGAAVLAGTALVLAACASDEAAPGAAPPPDPSPTHSDRNLVAADYDGRFVVTATVLESPGGAPELCFQVADSYPPQCGGPAIEGWDWDAVDAESAEGTTWGTYHLVGTFDGETFRLTEPATSPPEGETYPHRWESRLHTPCPEPEGGWEPVDPGKAGQDDMYAAFARAETHPDYAGAWIDNLGWEPEDEADPLAEEPELVVLNFRFAGDPAELESDLREVWGGPLCVTAADRSEPELREIQDGLDPTAAGVLTVGIDVQENAVVVEKLLATVDEQAGYDQLYGEGAVLLQGVMQPID